MPWLLVKLFANCNPKTCGHCEHRIFEECDICHDTLMQNPRWEKVKYVGSEYLRHPECLQAQRLYEKKKKRVAGTLAENPPNVGWF